MAQPQPPPQQQQHYVAHPPRPYSPPQPQNMHSPSPIISPALPPSHPTAHPQQFTQPPSKRQKLSPNPTISPNTVSSPHPQLHPQQNPTPYAPSPYGMSPNGSAHASPHFQNVQLPPGVYAQPLAPTPTPSYSTPYGNGNGNTPTMSIPISQRPPNNFQTSSFPSPMGHPNHIQQNHNQPPPPQGNYNNYPMLSQQSGVMGPPLKPADKLRDEVDPMDVLGGTGVNLLEEEQYMFQMQNNSFNSQQSGSHSGTISAGHSFTQFPPGDDASFYGAGAANTVADVADTKSREEYVRKMVEKAWEASAHDLAVSRNRELREQFVNGGVMHKKLADVALKHGLGLKWDHNKNMGEFKTPDTFARDIKSRTINGADASMVVVNGTFIPIDTQVLDQAALLSIALKHRLRELLEDSIKLSRGRQTGSHGIVPEEWADVAIEVGSATSNAVEDGPVRAGWESAISPHSAPPKRSFSSTTVTPSPLVNGKKTAGKVQIPNEVVTALRTAATKERDFEEARLKKRQARAAGEGVARQGSAAPGTPGAVANENTEKAPTKKELKKKQESKATEAATHAAANVTTAQFLGGGNNMFGKKKRYSWMTGGGTAPGSGASTPGRLTTSGLPAVPGGPVQPPVPERLTQEAARRLGQWREDQPKGSKVQLRDWIAVLEQDGRAKKALQKAYLNLDVSDPKGM